MTLLLEHCDVHSAWKPRLIPAVLSFSPSAEAKQQLECVIVAAADRSLLSLAQ